MSHKINRTVFKSRPILLDSFDMGQYGHHYHDITSDGIINIQQQRYVSVLCGINSNIKKLQ